LTLGFTQGEQQCCSTTYKLAYQSPAPLTEADSGHIPAFLNGHRAHTVNVYSYGANP